MGKVEFEAVLIEYKTSMTASINIGFRLVSMSMLIKESDMLTAEAFLDDNLASSEQFTITVRGKE